jgi:hypothetical protein
MELVQTFCGAPKVLNGYRKERIDTRQLDQRLKPMEGR